MSRADKINDESARRPKGQQEKVTKDALSVLNVFVQKKLKTPDEVPSEVSEKLVDVITLFLRSGHTKEVNIDEPTQVFIDFLGDNDCRVRCKISEGIKVMFEIFDAHVELFKDIATRLPQGMQRILS